MSRCQSLGRVGLDHSSGPTYIVVFHLQTACHFFNFIVDINSSDSAVLTAPVLDPFVSYFL